ncbi:MAG: cupin domain-containing protein [Tepidisphaeraceae bacterium]
MPSEICHQLIEQGFAGPMPVLSAEQCRRFLAVLSDPRRRAPMDWPKGQAVTSRAYFEVATHPSLMSVVEEMLGEDVLLFGACILTQRPGADHPWHSDIETSGPIGKTLSVWIGLENVSADSALQFVSYSHRFGATVQEVRQRAGRKRREATAQNVIEWAKQREPRAALVRPPVREGEALFFHGQAWHHSDNKSGRIRRALLLQYATPATPIRMPDPNCLDWPFRYRDNPRPACIMIRGSDSSGGVNRMVPAPAPSSKGKKSRITDQVCPLALPLAADEASGFTFYPMFSGATSDIREMEVHVSALRQNQMPHPPHTHREEEILLMLAGEADLILPQVKGPHGDERFPLKPGEFVYYPAHFPHSLRTTSRAPANYLMFKWDAERSATKGPALAFGHFNALESLAEASDPASAASVRTKKLFDGPTGCLRKLHAHASVLDPGAGYAPHADAYDVAIVVLEGEVKTLGQRIGAGGTIYHAAGQPHGIHNPGDTRARYVVFEFHGSQTRQTEAFPNPPVTLVQKITDPQRWIAKLKRVGKRLKGK